MPAIEILGRLAVLEHGHVLLTRRVGAQYSFLPGGHVEFGEGIVEAIRREAAEELGQAVTIERFLGVVENAFEQAGRPHHELSLVFGGRLPASPFPAAPVSREPHLEFLWQPVDRLAEANLLPRLMIDLLHAYVAGDRSLPWRSTLASELDNDSANWPPGET